MFKVTVTYVQAEGDFTEYYSVVYIGWTIQERLARANCNVIHVEYLDIKETYVKTFNGYVEYKNEK